MNKLLVLMALRLLDLWVAHGRRFNSKQAIMFKCRGLIEHDKFLTGRQVKR